MAFRSNPITGAALVLCSAVVNRITGSVVSLSGRPVAAGSPEPRLGIGAGNDKHGSGLHNSGSLGFRYPTSPWAPRWIARPSMDVGGTGHIGTGSCRLPGTSPSP